MTRRTLALAVLLVVCGLPAASPALAHDTLVVAHQIEAGPYLLEIGLGRETPRSSQDLAITVRALPGGAPIERVGGGRVTIVAVPAAGIDATQTRQIMLQPETHDRSSVAGSIQMPVRGGWTLEVQASGPAGEGVASVPLTVAGPPPIPVWLGWTVGLSPMLGLIWFARWNHAYLGRLLTDEPGPLRIGAASAVR